MSWASPMSSPTRLPTMWTPTTGPSAARAREGLGVVDERGFADELAHPAADHVDADHGAVGDPDQLDEAGRLQDLALAVAGQVIGERLDLVTGRFAGLRLGRPHRGHLGLAVRDPGDAVLVDDRRVEPGD